MRSWYFHCLIFALSSSALADAKSDYLDEIKPVLKERCYACHGALKQKAGLRLDSAAHIHAGGEDGEVLSKLIVRITSDDPEERMPPEGKQLMAQEIAAIENWLEAGAPIPEDEREEDDPREHWAFQRIGRPEIPELAESNPIDAFLGAKRRELGLQVQAAAEPSLLIRRLYLDLIGLPPTLEQLHDERPWESIVEELLSSPQHGERWGRHWMDVWRYSDWYGLGAQLRNSQRHLWHWRDWIVESLNADKGYDRMISEMLAGDEIAPGDPDVVRATGFLARNYYLFNRTSWLDSTIEHSGKAFLGLTLNCAKCHDHKYDPITQLDYYRFRAIFEPHHVRLDPVPGEIDLNRDGIARVFDDQGDAPTFLHIRGDEKNPDKERKIDPGVPAILSGFVSQPVALALPPVAYAPGSREYVYRDHLLAAERELAKAEAALQGGGGTSREAARAAVNWREAQLASVVGVIAAEKARYLEDGRFPELSRSAAEIERRARIAKAKYEIVRDLGDANKLGTAKLRLAEAEEAASGSDYSPIRASRKALEGPEHKFDQYSASYPETSTGRRLALAEWIVHRDNPLTARVAVNHVWMRHFGEPLVETVFDFGRRAKRPEHAELLDFLAVELIDSGWSLKHLHRLIVSSDAYRASSSNAGADPDTRVRDAGNRFYWRANPRRMESQLVRDSLLQLAGSLDLSMGGPPIDPGGDGLRRSLYFRHSRDAKDKFLSMFDDADRLACYRRAESIMPQQALALSNSKLAFEMAEKIAARIRGEGDRFIAQSFEAILGRRADETEIAACREFQQAQPRQEQSRARLILALLNHNDFVTIR